MNTEYYIKKEVDEYNACHMYVIYAKDTYTEGKSKKFHTRIVREFSEKHDALEGTSALKSAENHLNMLILLNSTLKNKI